MRTGKMGKKAITIFALLFLAGCATVPQNSTPATTVIVKYPELPPIPIPPMPTLKPFKFDIPRDMSRWEVKNTTKCKSVPEEQRDEKFWTECGIHPPIPNTNIFLGFDRENYENLIHDLIVLKEHILTLEKLLQEVNKQREEWRRKNAKSLENSRSGTGN